jgi:hypothetical protein
MDSHFIAPLKSNNPDYDARIAQMLTMSGHRLSNAGRKAF